MIFSIVTAALVLQSGLFETWTVETRRQNSPILRYQEFDTRSLTAFGDFFVMSGETKSFDARSRVSGLVAWSVPLAGISYGGWTIDQSVAYGGDDRGNLYAVDLGAKKILWRTATKGMLLSKPLVTSSMVFVQTSLGTLEAYQRTTGEWRWQQLDPMLRTINLFSELGPQLFSGLVVAGFPSSSLQAFQPETGQVVWKEDFALALQASDSFNDLKSISVPDEYLIASSFNGDLRVWRRAGSSKKLVFQKKVSLYSGVAADQDGRIYFSARDGYVYAVDLKNGFEVWKYGLARGLGGAPVIEGDTVWVASSEGEVHVIRRQDGVRIAKSQSTESSMLVTPLVYDNQQVITLTDKGILRSFALLPAKI